MLQPCSRCGLLNQIDDVKHEPGSLHHTKCARCGYEMEFTIPQAIEKEETVITGPPASAQPDIPAETVSEQQPAQPPVPEPASPPVIVPPPVTPPPSRRTINTNSRPDVRQQSSGSRGKNIIIAASAALIVIVFGLFYYFNVYLPAERDRKAPRYYPFATNVFLRSSPVAGIEANKITTVPYGEELIVYDYVNAGWSEVKFNGQEGYIHSDYILGKSDFLILNSIFGDAESKELIITAKCRTALLDYFKENEYIGNISDQVLNEILPSFKKDATNQWQVFALNKNVKINSVFFKRIYDTKSKFTDFAVLITNIQTSERKVLIFSFNNDETPFLIFEDDAPSKGYIKDIVTYTPAYSTHRHVDVIYK